MGRQPKVVTVTDPRKEAWLRYHDQLFGVQRRKPSLLGRLLGRS